MKAFNRSISLAVLSAWAFAADGPIMDNWAVYQAFKAGTAPEVIISAIRGSTPRFDLRPEEVAKLTNNGVPRSIIDAMSARQIAPKDQRTRSRDDRAVKTTAMPPAEIAAPPLRSAHVSAAETTVIPSGTRVSCRLEQTISSATADEGQQVQLVVTEDVRAGNVLLIAQGSPVIGTIVQSVAKRRMGRTGKLDFSIDKVRAMDGKFIPVRYSLNKKEGG